MTGPGYRTASGSERPADGFPRVILVACRLSEAPSAGRSLQLAVL